MPQLSSLASAAGLSYHGDVIDITGLAVDSRQVKPGDLFFAIPGSDQDGRRFIHDAVAKGAVAVVSTPDAVVEGAALLTCDNVRLAAARIAAAFYPIQPAHMAAVTGTDGKTSTADFYRQLAQAVGCKAASLGTLGLLGEDGRALLEGVRTTPDATLLHAAITDVAQQGYTHLCLEASSHGLHQQRLDGVRLDAAAFTNLARDHLDYHETQEKYFAAKARLFDTVLSKQGTAILNADDGYYDQLRALCAARKLTVLSYGREADDLRLIATRPEPHGQTVRLALGGRESVVQLPLVGEFQVYNILAAIGLLMAQGEDGNALIAAMPRLRGVNGRLELVANHASGAAIYIDYAHTPAALAKVLEVLRQHTTGALHVVFGCGGDRDAGKRPEMGAVAARLADRVIITDDNPRSEDAQRIRAQVMAGANGAEHVEAIAQREAAIYAASRSLQPGDILLVAGKGHETTQTIGDIQHPFSDAGVIRKAV